MADEKESGSEGVLGAAAGGAGGAVIGALLGGAVAGPVGALVGTAVGTMGGAAGGYAVDYGSHEHDFRSHHEADPANARHTFDQASPAYRYGWESHGRPELQGKSWSQVSHSLDKAWTGPGEYPEYEPYVKHGWERRASHAAQAGGTTP